MKGLSRILHDLDQGNIGKDEAEQRILRLFSVGGSYTAIDMGKAWYEGYHRKVDEINGNKVKYFDEWLSNYR